MSKDEPKWEALVENTAQCHTKLATGIQLAVERHCENKFSTSLRAFSTAKEVEIRDVCDTNHQDFANAIEELIRMKSDMIRVQENVLSFQMLLKDATRPVLLADDSLQAHLRTRRHIDESLDKLAQCQRIVGLASRVDTYINGSKLFHAYKLLQDLRAEVASFRGKIFLQQMNEWIDLSLNKIKEEAKKSVSSWLQHIRASSLEFGEAAIDRFENQVHEQYLEQDILENRGNNALGNASSVATSINKMALKSQNPSTLRDSITEEDHILSHDGIHEAYLKRTKETISPILRILHLFREMDEIPALAAYYNANRLPQLQLQAFLTGHVAMITPEKFMGQHQTLLKKLIGAFCVEHSIWRYTQGELLSKKDINGIFQNIIQSMCGILTASILRTRGPSSILDLKQNAVMCARTLGDELHQYNTTSIFDAFCKLGPHFRHSLLTDTKSNLNQFLSEDTFTRVHISKTDVKDTLELCGIAGNESLLKHIDLTQNYVTLPFTEIVRKSCQAIDALIQMMFDYERYLNINDWGDAVRDDTIEVLGYLNEILNKWIDDSSDLQVSMVVVMGVNASYLAVACDRFDQIVRHQTDAWESRTYGFGVMTHTRVKNNADSDVITKPLSKAGAKKQFENTTTRAQDMVCELMVPFLVYIPITKKLYRVFPQIKKIDELVNSFYYMDWTPAEASVQPDPAVWDLISYLQVTFAQLCELPTSVREAVHFASCIHISKSLEQILYGPNIKKITPAAIVNLKRNLDALLEFIDTLKIHHLRESFSSLNQLIDLLISGKLEIYLDPQSRETSKNFPQLSPGNIAFIHEKMKDSKNKFWGGSGHYGARKGKGIIGSVVKSLRK